MNCENCKSQLQSGAQFCDNCGAPVREYGTAKKSKKAIIAVVSGILVAALVLGALVMLLLSGDSASSRLAKVSVNTFSQPVKIIGNDITVGTDIETDIEVILPAALTEGSCFVKAGDISYYRKDDFEYYSYDTSAGLFRRVSPDADDETQEIGIGKILDYISAISDGDYNKLSELINGGNLAEDIAYVNKFIGRADEVAEIYFSDEYMTENYGFVYTASDEIESYSFNFSVNKLLDTVYEITEGSKDCFYDSEEYYEILSEIKDLREKLGENGDKMTVGIVINVKDGVYESIEIGVMNGENEDIVSVDLEFSDYGSATVDTEYEDLYNRRKEQLGEKDYLMWAGFLTFSDYYDED